MSLMFAEPLLALSLAALGRQGTIHARPIQPVQAGHSWAKVGRNQPKYSFLAYIQRIAQRPRRPKPSKANGPLSAVKKKSVIPQPPQGILRPQM